MQSYTTVKSISSKIKNEDYIDTFRNLNLSFNGFVLGDGIGSHYMPEEGSKFCVTKLKTLLEECVSIKELDFDTLYSKVYQSLKQTFENDKLLSQDIKKDQAYGTTLLCALEFEDKFVIAYLGNGSIWHVRGNFTEFGANRYLPWNAINILNPHTVEENGKEALYKFMSLDCSNLQIKPSVIEIKKDNDLVGDLLICSTDGLYSSDHNLVAKDKEGGLWISGEKRIELLFQYLKSFYKSGTLDLSELNEKLLSYLEYIHSNKLIDDDVSFGLIASMQSITYHKNLNENNSSRQIFIHGFDS